MATTSKAATNKPPAVPDAQLDVIRSAISDRRKAVGLSPEALSDAAGLSRAAVRNIEGGFANPALGTLYAVAGALGCHPAELLGGRPPTRPRTV